MAAPSTNSTGNAQPTQDELEDIILSARYGELEEIQEFVKKFGIAPLAESRDDRGNGCLHMAAANGHKGMPVLQHTASSDARELIMNNTVLFSPLLDATVTASALCWLLLSSTCQLNRCYILPTATGSI